MTTPPPTSWAAYVAATDYDDTDQAHLTGRVLREARRRVTAAREAAQRPRHCPRCRADKPTSEFGPNAARPDGLQVWCRSCRSDAPRP